jgi:regulator of protease activity HflC (stomatin/prohibitin superfamily)
MAKISSEVHSERVVRAVSGWAVLVPVVVVFGALVALVRNTPDDSLWKLAAAVGMVICVILLAGLFSLQPNEARVLVLFGRYKGTVRTSGFFWANPFMAKSRWRPQAAIRAKDRNKISLRARTLNGERLKVNDRRGNPIEIAAVVVWRVEDTARAMFEVDEYETFVPVQSEAALRHIANLYSYDDGDGQETTLRSNVDEVSRALCAELGERLGRAGVVVDEARLTHLAYAPEIAQVMLRSQQADAVIAARTKIVEGAVSMVGMALRELAEKDVVELDPERRASMVSNLMVVLCSESEVHPVVNTGTLYS